jgi:hypothetical protein
MALNKYVFTATVTVPAGTTATPAAGEPGTGGPAGFGNSSISAGAVLFPQTLIKGTPVVLDTASALYIYLNGQGVLRAWVQGTDDVSHTAISNLVLSEGRNFRISEGSGLLRTGTGMWRYINRDTEPMQRVSEDTSNLDPITGCKPVTAPLAREKPAS